MYHTSEPVYDFKNASFKESLIDEKNRMVKLKKLSTASAFNNNQSADEHVLEKSRTISQSDIFANNKTGSIEMLHENKKNSKFMSPQNQPSYKMFFSNKHSFSKAIKTRVKYPSNTKIEVIEEDSSSISPNTSFKRIKSNHIKDQEKYVQQEYQSLNGEIYEIKNKRTITKYNDNPELRKLVSKNLEIRGQEIQGIEDKFNFISLKSEPNKLALMLVEPREAKIKTDNDFTDESFDIMDKQKKFAERYENKYQKTGRSKTFLEDDVNYFKANDLIQQNKNSRNHFVSKANSKPSFIDEAENHIEIREKFKFKHPANDWLPNFQEIIPRRMVYTKTPQVLGRIVKSKRTDYQSKTVEETKSVQTQEDIVWEDSIKQFSRNISLVNAENSQELVRIENL